MGYSGEPENGAQWRYEKRSCINGSLVLPAVVNDIDTYYNDRAYAVAIDNDYVYAAGYYNPGVPDLRIAKRNRLDLLPSFLQPLNDQDNPISIGDDEEFRLRILLHVADGPLLQSGQQFRLQYGVKGLSVCADLSDASYIDVSDSTPIAFYDNPTALDGTALIVSSADPSHSGHITFEQTSEEQNGFTNSVSTIPIESDGMWDFSLQATASGTYCIRIVRDDGTEVGVPLEAYTFYPKVTVTIP